MAMHVNRNASDSGGFLGYQPLSEINVTPLVDVMLVLLIIFMITAPLMMAKLPIELPRTSAAAMGKPKQPLIVSLDARGQYYFAGTPVAAVDLPVRLRTLAQQEPDQVVYVRADKSIAYGQVMALLSEVGQAGFYKISLISKLAGVPQSAQAGTQSQAPPG